MKRQAELDHRRIGKDNKLFMFHELSPGSCFFMPHGTRLYNTLVNFIKNEYVVRGYQEVITPNIFHTDLWKISGHYKHYKDDMFLFNTNDKEEYALKPMNCPGHCLMFRHALRSWRNLPLRMADFGVLHRNELKGALGGLTRVRRFQQDDAHIFCRQSQIQQEVLGALDFMKNVYGVMGMTYKLERSTRPKKAVGLETEDGVRRWDDAEAALAAALDVFAGPGNWKDNPGDGAFYGPKIDIKVFDCMERMHQCATIQLDFNLPIRFNLKYKSEHTATAEDKKAHKEAVAAACCGVEKEAKLFEELPNNVAKPDAGFERPVMVHRAMLGSVERIIAILTEHFGGKWPLWLSPRQVMVIPLHETCNQYAEKVALQFVNAGFFAEAELGSKKYQRKIAEAQQLAFNYIVCVGPNDIDAGTAGLRARGNSKIERDVSITDIMSRLQKEVAEKALPSDMGSDTKEKGKG
jgi:threonyl-tRNA synthetase